MRPALAASGGWLLITSTPNGVSNHFAETWQNAEAAGTGWWLSAKTIADTVRQDGTPIIAQGFIDQELREGQSREWIDQEYYVKFTASLVARYPRRSADGGAGAGRITDLPYRPLLKVWSGWDIGFSDLTVVIYLQPMREPGERIHVLGADAYEGAALPEIIAGLGRRGYVYGPHLVPHDAGYAEKTSGATYIDVARGLGVKLTLTPRLGVLEGISAVRTLFGRLVFDRRGCQKLLEALGPTRKRGIRGARCTGRARRTRGRVTSRMHSDVCRRLQGPGRGPRARPAAAVHGDRAAAPMRSTPRLGSGRRRRGVCGRGGGEGRQIGTHADERLGSRGRNERSASEGRGADHRHGPANCGRNPANSAARLATDARPNLGS